MQHPFPWVPPHAGLSRWAVGCPNAGFALPQRKSHNPPPWDAPPHWKGTRTGQRHPTTSTSNLVPQPRTWGSLLAYEKPCHHWLFIHHHWFFMVSRQPTERPSLMLKNAPSHAIPLPMGSPSRWAEPLGCGLPQRRLCGGATKITPHGMPPRPTGEEYGRVNTVAPPQTSFRNRGLGELASPREIPSPLAFHGELPADWKAFPDVAKRPIPCMGSSLHAGLSCWAVGCPGRAVRWRSESPAPRDALPRGKGIRTGQRHLPTSNLVPQSRTWPGGACWPTRNLVTTGFS